MQILPWHYLSRRSLRRKSAEDSRKFRPKTKPQLSPLTDQHNREDRPQPHARPLQEEAQLLLGNLPRIKVGLHKIKWLCIDSLSNRGTSLDPYHSIQEFAAVVHPELNYCDFQACRPKEGGAAT
mmetsp:Transcript_2398/g.3843  ORF Transcript_2398/g.3843 Transcript_2398/m.3843 type:complete len:124 (+) Transcript_2398:1403-1774(+)